MLLKKRLIILSSCCLLLLGLTGCQRAVTPDLPEPTNLGAGAPVAISPDGDYLLVVRSQADYNEGWLQQTDGTNRRKVLEFTSSSFNAAFSPDGQYLAWTAEKLWLARSDGTNPEILLDNPEVGPLAWSPDSSQLAVVIGDSLERVNLRGQQLGQVVQAESMRSLRWAKLSSGERVFFTSLPAESPAFVGSVQPDGQGLTQLAEAETFDLAGDTIYYATPLSAGALSRASAIDGSGVTKLVASGVQAVAVRPPGKQQVAYLKLSSDGTTSDIWLVNEDGSGPQQLTSGAPVLGSYWSPDGSLLYYARFDLSAAEAVEPFEVQRIKVPYGGSNLQLDFRVLDAYLDWWR
jgi:Tol biopolymer transport system component